MSEDAQQEIDKEVKLLLTKSYERATALIEANKKELEIIAAGLIEYESLSGGEIVELLKGKAVLFL
jgi:cell division protease FtsH